MSRLQGVTPCKRLNAKIFSQCCCNPFIRGMRYFTALRSVQYDSFADGVILSKAKNLKKNADTTSCRTIRVSPSLQSLE